MIRLSGYYTRIKRYHSIRFSMFCTNVSGCPAILWMYQVQVWSYRLNVPGLSTVRHVECTRSKYVCIRWMYQVQVWMCQLKVLRTSMVVSGECIRSKYLYVSWMYQVPVLAELAQDHWGANGKIWVYQEAKLLILPNLCHHRKKSSQKIQGLGGHSPPSQLYT